jgi:hypothetical protein
LRRRVPGAYEKAWLSDAAAWIWGLCLDYLPEAEQIVDWYLEREPTRPDAGRKA